MLVAVLGQLMCSEGVSNISPCLTALLHGFQKLSKVLLAEVLHEHGIDRK